MKVFIILLISLNFVFATKKEFEKDWTHYDRKSITIMPTVWLKSHKDSRDFVIRKIVGNYARENNISKIELRKLDNYFMQNIGLKRFDKNYLPNEYYNKYYTFIQSNPIRPSISKYIQDSVVNPMYKIIMDSSYNRAIENADKTKIENRLAQYKDYGITEKDLESIMNSGYIFAPYIDGFTFFRNKPADVYISKEDRKEGYRAYGYTLQYGIILYKLVVKVEGNVNRPYIQKIGIYKKDYSGNINLKKESVKNFSFVHSILSKTAYSQVLDFELYLRKMEEFQLTGMYKEAGSVTTQLNLGTKEGLKRDQKYYIVQAIENENGVEQKKTGWVVLADVGQNDSNPDALTSAYVIKGSTDLGDKALEIVPKFNLAKAGINQTYYSIGLYNESVVENSSNQYLKDFSINNPVGLKWQWYTHNFGNSFGVNQLFWGLGFDFAFGGANGTAYYNTDSYSSVEYYLSDNALGINDSATLGTAMVSDFSFFIEKRYIFKRLMVAVKPFVSLRYLDVSAGSFEYDDSTDIHFFYRASTAGFGIEARGEYAWSPFTNIGFGVRVNNYANTSSLKLYGSESGMFPTWGRIFNVLSGGKIGSSSDVDVPDGYNQNIKLSHSGITFFISITKDYW